MHGRIKVKTTAEQQETKRKERAKRLQIYTAATNRVFEKRKNGEKDQEMLKITGEILSANPDFYTLWNIRKETFLHLKDTISVDELQSKFNEELSFLETCLKVNPKSYGSWEHRCWIMDNRPSPDWKRELGLCNKYLEYDERNFHCWDYRRFVVKRSAVKPEEEFDFTTQKISTNFSNYSSWHYRSKLLPLIHPDPANPVGVKEDVLLNEFDLAQNAFFTDPNDQSAWFYNMWLLGRGERTLEISCIYAERTGRVILRLSKPARVGKGCSIDLTMNGAEVKVNWETPFGKRTFSSLWYCHIPEDVMTTKETIKLVASLTASDTSSSRECALEADQEESMRQESMGNLFNYELSAATSSILTQELESCQQLFELEPDNKWTLLTIVLLMRAVDPIHHEQETMANLNKLKELDPCRKTYYNDLKSKFTLENAIEKLALAQRSLVLTNQDLSVIYHHDHLSLLKTIDLSGNVLRSTKNCQNLICVKKLVLNGNCLANCSGLEKLPCLEELSLQENSIVTLAGIEMLSTCPKLTILNLAGNEVTKVPNFREDLKRLLPQVTMLDGQPL